MFYLATIRGQELIDVFPEHQAFPVAYTELGYDSPESF